MVNGSSWVSKDHSTWYVVVCDECGEVDVDGDIPASHKARMVNHFGNIHAALYYSGYHDGKQHPKSHYQLSFPEERIEEKSEEKEEEETVEPAINEED